MGKCYAIRTDSCYIVDTWEEAERRVSGYPGAKFKKFYSKEEAKRWLEFIDEARDLKKPRIPNKMIVWAIYEPEDNNVVYGYEIVVGGIPLQKHSGKLDNIYSSEREVLGEYLAIVEGLNAWTSIGVRDIEIIYEHESSYGFAKQNWRPKAKTSKLFLEEYRKAEKYKRVYFTKKDRSI